MTDTPIPPGQGLAAFPDLLEGVSSPSGFTGVLVDPLGRITVTLAGQGVRATFADPLALRALGELLIFVADHRAAEAEEAAAAAAADLNRITAGFVAERTPDA